MDRISAFERTWRDGASEAQRTAVTVAVVAAHVVLIIVMWRSGWHVANFAGITLVTLPIAPEDRLREPVPVQEQSTWSPAEVASRHASAVRPSAIARAHVAPSVAKTSRGDTAGLGSEDRGNEGAAQAGSASEPAPMTDWHAEVRASVDALARRDSIKLGRQSLDGPKQTPLRVSPPAPACPFLKCESDWGKDLGVFGLLRSKAGRIEKLPHDMDKTRPGSRAASGDEAVLWYNNWCYQIVVSADPTRRGMTRCVVPVGKKTARGDLFDRMKERPSQGARATEVP